jgi:uncharacterized protein (TIRG00374 family)
MNITPGRWGRAVVSYTINRLTGIRFSETFPAVVADIFTDYVGFVIVCVASAFLVKKFFGISLFISLVMLIPFAFMYSKRLYTFMKSKFIVFKRLKNLFKSADVYFKYNTKIDTNAYLYSMVYTLPSMVLGGASLYFVILSFGIPIGPDSIATSIFILSIATLVGFITGIPANLGVTDASLISLLVAMFGSNGVNFGIASAITIFTRVANIWFVELVGFIALAYTFRYWSD